MKGSQWQLGKL